MKNKKEIEFVGENSWNYMGYKKGKPLVLAKIKKIKAYQPTEHDIMVAIIQWFKYHKWFVWRNNSGRIAVGEGRYRRMIMLGTAGMPDVLAIKDGIFAGVEVKRPKGKTTELQEQTLKDLEDHGAWTLVAYSVDDVEKKFKIV